MEVIRRSTLESCKPNEQLGPQASEIVWNRGHKLLQPHVHILNLISSERVYIYEPKSIFMFFFPQRQYASYGIFHFTALFFFLKDLLAVNCPQAEEGISVLLL